MKQKKNHIFQIICAVILTVSLCGLGIFYARLARENASFRALSEQLQEQSANAADNAVISPAAGNDTESSGGEVSPIPPGNDDFVAPPGNENASLPSGDGNSSRSPINGNYSSSGTNTETIVSLIHDEPYCAMPHNNWLTTTHNPSFSDPTEEEKALQNKYAGFISMNPDFIGWLRIDGTKIDYPVMMKPEDPDYYLRRDFSGKDAKSGTPYIGSGCTPCSDNVIIYSHNMKNGTMFADLLKYADEKFYQEHPTIQLDLVHKTSLNPDTANAIDSRSTDTANDSASRNTNAANDSASRNMNSANAVNTYVHDSDNSLPVITSETYQIIAVFREQIHYQDEVNVFRYYNYCGELSPRSYYNYIQKIKSISLYDTGHSASYGQQLITLSTCSYHTENGRFVVVAAQTSGASL